MRRLLRLLCLCVLLASAGCTTLGPGSVDEGALESDIEYTWNTSTDATLTLEKDRYVAVYHLSAMESVELSVPRRFNSDQPVDPIGPEFRYPNGTVVNITKDDLSRGGGATTVTLPSPNGSLAFAANRNGKTLRKPIVVNGSYTVVLPPGGRVQYPLLARVLPGGFEAERGPEGRVHLTWDSMQRNRLLVDYYLQRDLLLLAGLVGASTIAILIVTSHYLVSIKKLRRRRESVDVEYDDTDR